MQECHGNHSRHCPYTPLAMQLAELFVAKAEVLLILSSHTLNII